ncbi:hypothetical protein V502_08995, partial [Pseudogymnoascus sp. VKM F-4520 (FW-2644)]
YYIILFYLSLEYSLACECGLKVKGRPDDDYADHIWCRERMAEDELDLDYFPGNQ